MNIYLFDVTITPQFTFNESSMNVNIYVLESCKSKAHLKMCENLDKKTKGHHTVVHNIIDFGQGNKKELQRIAAASNAYDCY